MQGRNDPAGIVTARPARLRALVAALAVVVLGACSESPLGPDDGRATMRVGAAAMSATALGESVVIEAAVIDSRGEPLPDAGVHWELSAPGVLEAIGDGRFRVLKEGTVQVAAVWPRDPSVRAGVTVAVNASIMAAACIVRSDQAPVDAPPRCARSRVVVSAAPTAAALVARAGSGEGP